ncbi:MULTISPECIES: type III secretion system inner membrane ring lipoprotein SctJ [Dyella]|uniref:Lipoprotein n=2 Tax=Dyella TaxID=231454 RepID=A0A4R0YYG8_9GAMM|nr:MULTISPECIES: type III secretion inner membrane ring lipoprotein SctJ [Dyella]TBR38718.1 EscJ/YscJ/HrcJ family type III secretion inner membrane ring protein [Dyella terrae]TCI13691.1 EscJ/YscJ/HrcJ family type III secretion inner membrane ring protein [Dyella soli]
MNRFAYRWACFCVMPLLAGCHGVSLLEDLDERQANEVLAVLLESHIPAEKIRAGKQGYAVQVERADLPAAVEIVRLRQVPAPPRRHVDRSFAADALVSTPQAERARLYSAIEQRLEESVSLIDGVVSARVHVNYDVTDAPPNRTTAAPTHLSVLAVTQPGVNEDVLIASIKRFLRNSFGQVAYENISVIVTPTPAARVAASSGRHATPSRASWLGWGGGAALVAIGVVLASRRRVRSAARRWRRKA